jgi:hypothetical protein
MNGTDHEYYIDLVKTTNNSGQVGIQAIAVSVSALGIMRGLSPIPCSSSIIAVVTNLPTSSSQFFTRIYSIKKNSAGDNVILFT